MSALKGDQKRKSKATAGPGLRLAIDQGGMTARISGAVPPGTDRLVIQERITNLIQSKGIKYGVSAERVKGVVDALATGDTLDGVVIAKGLEPVPGDDARLELLVDIHSLTPEVDDKTGKIDVRDRGRLPLVTAGTPLVRLYPATKGKSGRDLFDKIIPPKHAKLLRLIAGRGVELREGGLLAVSTVDGMVSRPEEDTFEVLEILEIDGDVDFSQGHINFPGLVRIRGAVLPDFKVRCKNLEVEALEPGSMVEVSGDLVVHGGILRAAVKVGGSASATYISQSRMVCGGDLTVANELLQSRIQCGGAIRVTSATGRIVNSHLEAVRGVLTNDLVSSGKGGSVIRLGVSPAMLNRLYEAKRNVEKYRKERRQLSELIVGQREELDTMEQEMRATLTLLKDPREAHNADNLKAQLNMIRPLRENLKAGVEEGEKRLEDLLYIEQKTLRRIQEMEALIPVGAVWLDVRGTADASTEIKGPNSSITLESSKRAFSMREVEVKGPDDDGPRIVMRASPLREVARY